jgi:hypothetical protein
MDRTRFEHLLEAYGADFRRWPANERAAAAAFAAQHAADIAAPMSDARTLDALLEAARETSPETELLARRILAAAPRTQSWAFDRRSVLALAACAVFGVVLGYGGGHLAPPAVDDDSYFAMAFEAPFLEAPEDEG